MKVLITGRGTSGSWKIRGEQLGAALGATVQPNAPRAKGYDVVVVVKRLPSGGLGPLRDSGALLVWDIVDAWPQPIGNTWDRFACMSWLESQVRLFKPDALVAATTQMSKDCAELGIPALALPHHTRPGQAVNKIRDRVKTVGYEGAHHYLGFWRRAVEDACNQRGWQFVLNPPQLSDVDIVVALREADGYAARMWKSNVKLANAQGTGTPFVGSREAGYVEHSIGNCERWADTPEDLDKAFNELSSKKERDRVSLWMQSVAPRLPSVASTYRQWLEDLVNETVH